MIECIRVVVKTSSIIMYYHIDSIFCSPDEVLHHMGAARSTNLVSITFNQLCCNAQALISVASDGKLGLALMARSDATVGPAGDEDSQGHRHSINRTYTTSAAM